MDRRRFVLGSFVAGTTSLAGCPFLPGASGQVPPPEVSGERLQAGGWERRDSDTFEDQVSGGSVTTSGHTVTYTDVALREEIAEKTLGAVTGELSVFFATRVEFSPPLDNLPLGVGRDEVLRQTKENAKDDFEERLEENGLTDVTEEGEASFTADSGYGGDLVQYGATYPFDDFSFAVSDGETVQLAGRPLAVAGRLTVWYDEDRESTLVAGSIHAGENYVDTVEKQLSAAIDLTLDIDLGLTPEAYREEALGLMRSVR